MSDAILSALSALAARSQEQDERIAELEARAINAEARLEAQFKLLEQLRRPTSIIPTLRPVWREEVA